MSGNKRPLIGRRELQALVASTDTFLRNPAPVEEDAVEATGLTLLPSPHARQMSTFPNPRRTVGQLSLPAPNNSVAVVIELNGRPVIGVDDMSFSASFTQARSNIIEKREGKEKEAAWARFQSKQANPVPDHGHHTRAAAGRRRAIYLHHQQLKDFNTRFRALPKEIREMIFPFAIVWDGKKAPGLIVGLRSKRDDPNHYLYQEALGAFYSNNTFVLTRKNSYTLNRVGGGVMLPVVWETIRNLAIKHE
jgi:hypothetical protein